MARPDRAEEDHEHVVAAPQMATTSEVLNVKVRLGKALREYVRLCKRQRLCD